MALWLAAAGCEVVAAPQEKGDEGAEQVAATTLPAPVAPRSPSEDQGKEPPNPEAETIDAASGPADGGQARTWASGVKPLAAARPPGHTLHERAVMPDRAYANSSLISVRRLVYRVHYLVPKSFRETRTLVRPPAGELTVDVSNDRLRARFFGSTWPVQEGTEIRLRRDTLGVYAFDGNGGRQLSPGQLAMWFEGRGTPGVRATVRVRRETGRIAPGPGELVCALLAEWTGQPRDSVMRRCVSGGLPPWFAFGPWRAELTAVVPLELPASQMRGDELSPPDLKDPNAVRAVLASNELALIRPLRPLSADLSAPHTLPEGSAEPGDGGSATRPILRLVNEADARALVFAAGIPLAWIDAHSEGDVVGLQPGRHMVGALRAFGTLAITRRPVEVPGTLALGARR